MFDRIFANYLADQQILDRSDLDKIFEIQEQKRVRLGVIAISEGLMTNEQVEEVNLLQSTSDKRFGDIAVEKGYLTDSQVTRLLALQGNRFLTFIQAVVDYGTISMPDVIEALNTFQRHNSYTLTDIDNLKSCDIDRIMPIYVYELPDYAKELSGVALRTISRRVDYHVYIDKTYTCDKLIVDNLCMQESKGDHNILLAISGSEDALMTMAVCFAGPKYIEELEDAQDTACEIINNINGLFATELSRRNINIDMLPPYYKAGSSVINSEEIINIPFYVKDKELTLSIILSDNYTTE